MSITRVFIKAVKIGVVCLAGYFVGSVAADCVKNGKKAVKDAEKRKQNGDGKLYEFEFDIDSGMCAEGEDEIWKDTAASYEDAEAHIRRDSEDFGFKIKSIGRVVEPESSVCGTPEEFYHWQATKDEPIPFKEKAKIFGKAAADELLTKDNVWSLICAFSIAAYFFTGMQYGRLEMKEDLIDNFHGHMSMCNVTNDDVAAKQWGGLAAGICANTDTLKPGEAVVFGRSRWNGIPLVSDVWSFSDVVYKDNTISDIVFDHPKYRVED